MKTVFSGDILNGILNSVLWEKYCIQPNYPTVHSGFSKLLGKLEVKYVSTYIKTAKLLGQYISMFVTFCLLIFFFHLYSTL